MKTTIIELIKAVNDITNQFQRLRIQLDFRLLSATEPLNNETALLNAIHDFINTPYDAAKRTSLHGLLTAHSDDNSLILKLEQFGVIADEFIQHYQPAQPESELRFLLTEWARVLQKYPSYLVERALRDVTLTMTDSACSIEKLLKMDNAFELFRMNDTSPARPARHHPFAPPALRFSNDSVQKSLTQFFNDFFTEDQLRLFKVFYRDIRSSAMITSSGRQRTEVVPPAPAAPPSNRLEL